MMTLTRGGISVDLVSPVEGVTTAINKDALQDPSIVAAIPMPKAGVESPELALNQRNLVQGAMVAPWMQNNVTRLNGHGGACAPSARRKGAQPACIEACPVQASISRYRDEILEEAQRRILNDAKYVKYTYGRGRGWWDFSLLYLRRLL